MPTTRRPSAVSLATRLRILLGRQLETLERDAAAPAPPHNRSTATRRRRRAAARIAPLTPQPDA